MDSYFLESLGIAETKFDRPFNQRRMQRNLARALRERASQGLDPSQDDEQKATFIEGLKSKIQDKKSSWQGQEDVLGAIKTRTKNAMDGKRENAQALIDEYECLPINERIPALRAEFSSRIQDLSSNPVMTALPGNDGSFFEGIIRRNPATFVDL